MSFTPNPPVPNRADKATFPLRMYNMWVWFVDTIAELSALGSAYNLATSGTSSTSNNVTTGAKSFIVAAGLGLLPGMPLNIARTSAAGTTSMFGYVTGYAGTSLSFNAISVLGSGSGITDWTFSLAATQSGASLAANIFSGLQRWTVGANIASAATIDLTAATGNTLNVTGIVPTSAFVITAGQWMRLIAPAGWQLTFHPTNCNITGGASYTCAAGDRLSVFKSADGVTYVDVVKQDGTLMASVSAQPFRQTVISGPVGGDTHTGVSITVASPGVITVSPAHGKENDTPFYFTTGGTFPTGLAANTQYFARSVSGATLQASATAGGASINTTGSAGSGLTLVWGLLNNANGTPLLGGGLGGTSVTTSNINATTPLRVSYAGGYNASGQVDLVGTSTANLTFSSLSTNGTMYGYLTYSAGGNTTSTGTLAPVVQQQGIPSIVNGQYTYNIKEAKMYLGNGSVASAVNAVHVATFTVAAGVVSAITWIPFQRIYSSSGYSSSSQTVTSAGLLTLPHYLPAAPDNVRLKLRCVAAEAGWSIGDEFFIGFGDYQNGRHLAVYCDSVNIYVRYGNSANVFSFAHKTTGASTVLTNSSWNLLVIA